MYSEVLLYEGLDPQRDKNSKLKAENAQAYFHLIVLPYEGNQES